MNSNYYYIDENDNKQDYFGNVIHNADGTFEGQLTTSVKNVIQTPIEYHPLVPGVKGWSSYYTYVNNLGETMIYDGSVKTNGTSFSFTYLTDHVVKLTYHPDEEATPDYYTYMLNNEEVLFDGTPLYDRVNKSYYFIQ